MSVKLYGFIVFLLYSINYYYTNKNIILLYGMLPHNHDGLIIHLKFLNILIIFNISNINKEINKELPEDDLMEDRNMFECFLKCFKWFWYNLKDRYIVVWKSVWVDVNKT